MTSADFPRTELPGGETVTAEVSFAVDPDETGDYYIQYKPETLDAARGIWQYTISDGTGTAHRGVEVGARHRLRPRRGAQLGPDLAARGDGQVDPLGQALSGGIRPRRRDRKSVV